MNGLSPDQLMALQQMMRQGQQDDSGLLSFKAGRSNLDPISRMVTSDKKRGKIRLRKDQQGLLHFEWMNRISNNVDLDLIVMPHEAKWQRVEECPDGRVYILRMVMANTKHFFWVQEPQDDEKDKERDEKMHEILSGQSSGGGNATAAPGGLGGMGGMLGGLGGAGGQLSQAQLLSMIGNGGRQSQPPAAAAATAAPSSSSAPASGGGDQALAQNFLEGLLGQGGNQQGGLEQSFMAAMQQVLGGDPQAARIQQIREQLENEPDLNDVLNPEDIAPLLEDEEVLAQLAPHLPEEMKDAESIREQINSPHFRAAVARLEAVINGPQMAMIVQSLGLQPDGRIGVRAFIEAIQNRHGNSGGDENAGGGGGVVDDGEGDNDVDMPDA